MAIRSWGATWRLQTLLSLLAEAVFEYADNITERLETYERFLEYVDQNHLGDAHLLRPILDG